MKKRLLVLSGAFVFIAVSVLFIFMLQKPSVHTITMRGSLPDYSLEDMKANASLVAAGKIEEISEPFIVEAENTSIQIYRDCAFRPETVLRGNAGGETVTVRISGGTVDRLEIVNDTSAQLVAGQEYILFLYQPGTGGDTLTEGDYYLIMGGQLGAFEKVRQSDLAAADITDTVLKKQVDDREDGIYLSYLHSRNKDIPLAFEKAAGNRAVAKECILTLKSFQQEMEAFNKEVPVNENWFVEDTLKNMQANLENGMMTQEEYELGIAKMDVYGRIADAERTKEIVKEYTQ